MNQVRQAVWSINPDLPLARVRTMEEAYRASMARSSFALVMLAISGGMALLLGVIGIYGVISYSVNQRMHEFAMRVALGAARWDVMRLVLGHGLRVAGLGVVIGLIFAAALGRLLGTLLYEVSATDPLTFAGVAAMSIAIQMTR